DRYGVPFSALGLLLGILAVAGSIGALLHGRFVAARLGAIPSIVLVETLSLPFALVAAFTGALPIAVGALATRHFLMFGASGTVNAFQLSSFTPAERAGANAVFALAWSAANAVGAILSGAIRSRLGPDGFTVNLALKLAKQVRKPPREIARAIRERVPVAPPIAAVEELSGFVNVRLDEKWLATQVDEIVRAGTDFGRSVALAGKRLQVEFVSANPTGPLTVANARGGPLGDVL